MHWLKNDVCVFFASKQQLNYSHSLFDQSMSNELGSVCWENKTIVFALLKDWKCVFGIII